MEKLNQYSAQQVMQNFFSVAHKESILYCHWKSNEHLKDALEGKTDLDILVAQDQKKKCEETLKECGFRQVFSPSFAAYPFIEDWIGFDSKTGSLIHLHLHYKLLTGKKLVKEQFLPWEDKVLATRVFNEEFKIYTIEPNLELIILALRIGIKTSFIKLLPGKCLPKNIVREINYLRQAADKDAIYRICVELFGEKEGRCLHELMAKLNSRTTFLTIVKLKSFVQKNLSNQRRFNLIKANLCYFLGFFKLSLRRLFNKLGGFFQLKKTFRPRGIVVAVIGADGSGKSTIVNSLHRWLSWKVDVCNIYLGQNKGILMRFLGVIYPDLRSVLSAKSKHKKVLKAHKLSNRGSIVLTDRYPQKQFFGINDGPHIGKRYSSFYLNKLLFKLEDRLYSLIEKEHKPDIVIKLNISLQEALSRKKVSNAYIIKDKIKIIKELVFLNSIVINIDASEPVEKVLLEAKRKIWESIRKKCL